MLTTQTAHASTRVRLRDYPYPYRSAIAISNDCEFTSWETQLSLYRSLSGKNGLGLEISNSLFFFVTNSLCHSTFSYFQGTSDVPTAYAPVLREMIRAGYIDTVHAYGDFDDGTFQRRYAERIADECQRMGLALVAWSNHGSDRNFQNLGHRRLTQYQQGDNPDHPCYHLDLLKGMGVCYHWVDDGYTPKPGDETPILYHEEARDGRGLILFRRYRGLVGQSAPTASRLPEQVLLSDIDSIVANGRACIVYQHFGCWQKTSEGMFEANQPPYFSPEGMRVLERLAEISREGKCLVATVGRLLRYLEARDAVAFTVSNNEIMVSSASVGIGPQDLAGVTFYAPDPERMRLTWRAKDGATHALPSRVFRESETGQPCIGVPWKKLEAFQW
ncbi:MAG: hypothetical protein FJ245_05490 [Nitrospira sp.]|nr:hypothetical protein [Nitrospira sp.]